jgi:hypothetical protein
VFISPADPTVNIDFVEGKTTQCSYAFNMIAFSGPPNFTASFSDGTSSTIAYSERYCTTADRQNLFLYDGPWFDLSITSDGTGGSGPRRPSFADPGFLDVVPVTDESTATTRPSVPGMTFQVHPTYEQSDGRIVQTPFEAGLPVAFFDGSVRLLGPGISEGVFWALVTPRGGEVVTDY